MQLHDPITVHKSYECLANILIITSCKICLQENEEGVSICVRSSVTGVSRSAGGSHIW